MSYTPPQGDALEFDWQNKSSYTPPQGGNVSFAWENPLKLIVLQQSVKEVEVLYPAQTLLQLKQATVGFQPAKALVDFYQRAVRSEPIAPILTLLQQVRQRHVAGILIELSQSVSQLTQQPAALIRLSQSVVHAPIDDWEASAPTERQTIYVLDVGSVRVPISSAQATMRLSGQSFLQAVIPNAGAYATELAAMVGETMLLRSGYLYADGALSSLEIIAAAPFQLSSQATGPVNDTLTISGYGHRITTTSATRALRGIQTSTIGQDGKRRVRCALDLFLRPGHTALDNDGTALTVNIIQYFINATSDGMEVIS